MIGSSVRRIKRRPKTSVAITITIAGVALNSVAFMHAYAMTHFTQGGVRTAKPDDLSAVGKAKVLVTGVQLPKPVNRSLPSDHGLGFTTHHFSSGDNVELEGWHIPCANSKGLWILFHGYNSCKSNLLQEAATLHSLGYESFLIDFRGCGGSSGYVTTIGFHEADDVIASVEYANRQLSQELPILYGQSMGSAAALRATTLQHLDLRALVLECPFDRLLTTAENRFALMGLPSFPFAELLIFWGGVQNGFSGFDHNPIDYAQHVSCPVLVMSGEDDERATKAQVTSVFEQIPEDKHLRFFPGLGHEACHHGDAKLWRQTIADFLSTL